MIPSSDSTTQPTTPILAVEELRTYFTAEEGIAKSVDGVSFRIRPAETLALVGESGSGKSVTALSIMRLLPPEGWIEAGSITFSPGDGTTHEIASQSEKEMLGLRGKQIGMIFQEPMTSLNPVMTVGDQIMEPIRIHNGLGRRQARTRALELIDLVGIAEPLRRVDEFPHLLSGGMRQRVMIAIAIASGPKLLIADEPTTALDVTIQAQILRLLTDLKDELGMSMLFITHNLGVVAEVADQVVVMYAGRVVEEANVDDIFHATKHPYTKGLLASIPRTEDLEVDGPQRLRSIPGGMPSATRVPPGCAFAPRCEYAQAACEGVLPPIEQVHARHACRCLRWREI